MLMLLIIYVEVIGSLCLGYRRFVLRLLQVCVEVIAGSC